MMIGVCHSLRALFAGGVRLERFAARSGFGRRVGRVGAVYAGCGGDDKRSAAGLTADFQHIQRPGDVGFDEHPGIFHAETDSRASGEVDHAVEMMIAESRMLNDFALRNIGPNEGEAGHFFELAQAVFLHARIVGIVHIVDAGHGMTLLDQNFTCARTDKACCTGDKVVGHRFSKNDGRR